MSDKKDDLGDRIKAYESASTHRRAFKGQPIVARLDGRGFHTFTKGLNRPYDVRFTGSMLVTMGALVEKFKPKIAYSQSDEITLVWYVPAESKATYDFGGRFQKFDSLLAGFASAAFNEVLYDELPEKAGSLATFDCRTFVVPNLTEAYHTLLWRQQDATKNAISMAAQSMFSHKELQHKHSDEMQEMMFSKHGVNFNDYPDFFKRGTFASRVTVQRKLTPEELAKIPEKHRPTSTVPRSEIQFHNIWLTKLENPVDFLFNNAEARYKIDKQEAGQHSLDIQIGEPECVRDVPVQLPNEAWPFSWDEGG